MLSWIRAGWTIAGFPVRAAWKGYSALWWAFEDDAPTVRVKPLNRAAQAGTPGAVPVGSLAAASFSKPAKPTKALKKGFIVTLVTSALGAWAMTAVHHAGHLSDPKAIIGGLWIAGAACVVSLMLVRRGERQRLLREASPTPINTVKRGLRQAAATMRACGASASCAARAKAARFAANAGLGRLVR